jgi:hypothetical protein
MGIKGASTPSGGHETRVVFGRSLNQLPSAGLQSGFLVNKFTIPAEQAARVAHTHPQ